MNLVLFALLLGSTPVPAADLSNLDFRAGTLTGWEGEGFAVVPGSGGQYTVSSADTRPTGRTALLHRAIVLPADAGVLRCTAHAVHGKAGPPGDKLDVVLLAAGKRVVPKEVRAADGWQRVARLLPADQGQSREYVWHVGSYAGQTVRLALIDEDDRPGCHVVCGGFQLLPRGEFEAKEFNRFMVRLQEKHRLAPLTRYDTKHFTALSNADEKFCTERLQNCEVLYALFCDHFRRKGFAVHDAPARLMVALFDSQRGFEAYLGQRVPPEVTGIYHTPTNRLVVYDYGGNDAYLAIKKQTQRQVKQVESQLDRLRHLDNLSRRAQDVRRGTSTSTVLHEVAHHLSFNCGLLNRGGDVAFWLAEGLACYCEATTNGSWQGIGALNRHRMHQLESGSSAQGGLIPLRALVTQDLFGEDGKAMLPAYAQSWALFRLLMEERPAALRKYLELIHSRRTPDHRLTDFQEAFGADLGPLERRYVEYVKNLLNQLPRPPR
jgi:hypothetical protein